MRKPFLAAAVLVAGLVAIFYLAFSQERVVPLAALVDPPRPPVRADPRSAHITLSGHLPQETDRGNDARRLRNALGERHAQALSDWRAGRIPLRAAEAIEMDLHLARHRLREITDAELHTLLGLLLGREVERLEQLRAKGLASAEHVAQARLYQARERHMAGAKDTDYDTRRLAFLAETKQRHERLADLGLGNREQLALEYETLEEEFGPIE